MTTRKPRPERPRGLNAPGLVWYARTHDWILKWVARKDISQRGYPLKERRLWPPSAGPGAGAAEPTHAQWLAISSQCETLQGEMLAWGRGDPKGEWDPRSDYDGTVRSLIRIYQRDPDSPYKQLRYRTRLRYDSMLRTLEHAIGDAIIPSLIFRDFKRWYEGFAKPKTAEGQPRKARAHACMQFVRLTIKFGVLLRLAGCEQAAKDLDGMEFAGVRKRKEKLTAEQVIAICAEAHRRGLPSIALAQAMMFELTMRPKDIVGEWIPISEPGLSEITCGDEKWLHGAHWKEIDARLMFKHRLSKSLKGREATLDPDAGKTEEFDLTAYPMIMEELAHVPPQRRTGPVVVFENTGRPWNHKHFAARWREIATAVGVPKNVQNRDSRAGGITEGIKAGASLEHMRTHAAHSQLSTTAGYHRGDVEDKNTVARLRVQRRKTPPATK